MGSNKSQPVSKQTTKKISETFTPKTRKMIRKILGPGFLERLDNAQLTMTDIYKLAVALSGKEIKKVQENIAKKPESIPQLQYEQKYVFDAFNKIPNLAFNYMGKAFKLGANTIYNFSQKAFKQRRPAAEHPELLNDTPIPQPITYEEKIETPKQPSISYDKERYANSKIELIDEKPFDAKKFEEEHNWKNGWEKDKKGNWKYIGKNDERNMNWKQKAFNRVKKYSGFAFKVASPLLRGGMGVLKHTPTILKYAVPLAKWGVLGLALYKGVPYLRNVYDKVKPVVDTVWPIVKPPLNYAYKGFKAGVDFMNKGVDPEIDKDYYEWVNKFNKANGLPEEKPTINKVIDDLIKISPWGTPEERQSVIDNYKSGVKEIPGVLLNAFNPINMYKTYKADQAWEEHAKEFRKANGIPEPEGLFEPLYNNAVTRTIRDRLTSAGRKAKHLVKNTFRKT